MPEPLVARPHPRAGTRRQRSVLTLLVVGETPATIARQLFVAPRTVEADVAAVKNVVGATTQYTLGVFAIRHGLLGLAAVEMGIRRRTGRNSWIEPDERQDAIIQCLADGDTYAKVSVVLGLAERTIRRDMTRLAAANGVERLVTAGALFEARAWHHSTRRR